MAKHLGVLLAGLLLGFFYFLGGMGMGDVKLCAAIGAWICPRQLVTALVVMGIAGGVMAVRWAACGGFFKESLNGAGDLVFGVGNADSAALHPVAGESSGAEDALCAGHCNRNDIFFFGGS